MDLATLYDNGQVGPGGFFDYVGSERSNGKTVDGKPLTEFLRTNEELPMPSIYTNMDAAGLAAIMQNDLSNGLNPGHVSLEMESMHPQVTGVLSNGYLLPLGKKETLC